MQSSQLLLDLKMYKNTTHRRCKIHRYALCAGTNITCFIYTRLATIRSRKIYGQISCYAHLYSKIVQNCRTCLLLPLCSYAHCRRTMSYEFCQSLLTHEFCVRQFATGYAQYESKRRQTVSGRLNYQSIINLLCWKHRAGACHCERKRL